MGGGLGARELARNPRPLHRRANETRSSRSRRSIFPRYHQLDATRSLRAAVLAEGPGRKYLIQHSAGSGKTNSIAWSAHFLADLHDAAEREAVLDRDRRLRPQRDRQPAPGGAVRLRAHQGRRHDDQERGSEQERRSSRRRLPGARRSSSARSRRSPSRWTRCASSRRRKGKRFAVIADEAHSSQTGEAAAKLKAVLSPEELAELEDGGEVSSEDILAAQMAARASDKGITYVAFTATPKAKTMELFGRRPSPNEPASETNKPQPFHVYSMRQAIEEGFILDVLKNYTPYKLAFRLAHNGKEYDETEVERSAAMKGIMSWVRLHPYNISQKVQIVVEHFRENVAPLLDGKAKAMVVLASRVEAVRWQLAITKYIKSAATRSATLVAFSGEVDDPESGPDPFSETSKTLNPNLQGPRHSRGVPRSGLSVLLVANKFQTGFDEPLLCGMYVDRRLAGIQAVQTLSRLNRAHPGKDTTYILDFVNSADEILTAFKTYYETAELEDVTDPNLVYNLRAKLDATGFYDDFEVDRVVEVELNPKAKQGDLVAALEPGRGSAAQAVQGGAGAACDRARAERREGREGRQGRAERADPVQERHRRVPAHVHLPLADVRLRQHRHREAVHLLSPPHAAAGVRPRA